LVAFFCRGSWTAAKPDVFDAIPRLTPALTGAPVFARIRCYLSTCRKQGRNLGLTRFDGHLVRGGIGRLEECRAAGLVSGMWGRFLCQAASEASRANGQARGKEKGLYTNFTNSHETKGMRRETVKTVELRSRTPITPLKRGVNKKGACERAPASWSAPVLWRFGKAEAPSLTNGLLTPRPRAKEKR